MILAIRLDITHGQALGTAHIRQSLGEAGQLRPPRAAVAPFPWPLATPRHAAPHAPSQATATHS